MFILSSLIDTLAVQSTFLVLWLFPPPTSGTNILARSHGTRAARAPDAEEPFVVKWIVGNLVLPDAVPNLLVPTNSKED